MCARDGCNQEFEKTAHNMKYCSPECRKVVSGEKISARYKRIRATKSDKNRTCVRCEVKLSIYNYYDYCSSCKYIIENANLLEILRMLDESS